MIRIAPLKSYMFIVCSSAYTNDQMWKSESCRTWVQISRLPQWSHVWLICPQLIWNCYRMDYGVLHIVTLKGHTIVPRTGISLLNNFIDDHWLSYNEWYSHVYAHFIVILNVHVVYNSYAMFTPKHDQVRADLWVVKLCMSWTCEWSWNFYHQVAS